MDDRRIELQAEVDGHRDELFALVSSADGLARWLDGAEMTAIPGSRIRLRMRDAVVVGGSRRVQATRPESTLGGGQKTVRPTEPARRTSANQAALTDGTPY